MRRFVVAALAVFVAATPGALGKPILGMIIDQAPFSGTLVRLIATATVKVS